MKNEYAWNWVCELKTQSTIYSLYPLQGPYAAGQQSAQVLPLDCSSSMGFYGRKATSPGLYLLRSTSAKVFRLISKSDDKWPVKKKILRTYKMYFPLENKGWDKFSSQVQSLLGRHLNSLRPHTKLSRITLIRIQWIQTHCGLQEGWVPEDLLEG